MDAPAGLAAEAGQNRANIALSAIKQSAEQGRRLAEIIDQDARSAPISQTLGSNVNITA